MNKGALNAPLYIILYTQFKLLCGINSLPLEMISFPLLCFLYHSRNMTSNNTMTQAIAATTIPTIIPTTPEDELPAPSLTPPGVLLGPTKVWKCMKH